ncbi:MAG: type IV toxin-antitoxin system AbiEi family antitoxin domain-containing protein [Actinomycetota bacterium]|nr:type IV toxin-antitoxin system AbiEi family antitoxin domain-containing protein [Actinomycetota bacterium]
MLARLAARQHGVVGVRQLYALGYPRRTIAREVERGSLHRLHRGVYAVGHARLSSRGHWMAAVIACRSGAVLSHHAAAALWDLRHGSTRLIDVTAGGHSPRQVRGVRFHAVRSLHPEDTAIRDGIPVTSVARTLLDLAEVLHPQRLRLALEAAERQGLLDAPALEAMLERNPGRHGIKPLRRALAAHNGSPPWTQSELERAFLVLIRQAGLPEPQCNVLVEGELVDCFWAQGPLVVELDGYAFHRTRRTFEADRRRDTKLQLAGIPVLRFTQPRVKHEPHQVLSVVSRMLSVRGPGPGR